MSTAFVASTVQRNSVCVLKTRVVFSSTKGAKSQHFTKISGCSCFAFTVVSFAILFEEKEGMVPKKYFRMAISVAFSSPAAKSLLLHLTHLEYACRAALRKMDPPPRSPLMPRSHPVPLRSHGLHGSERTRGKRVEGGRRVAKEDSIIPWRGSIGRRKGGADETRRPPFYGRRELGWGALGKFLPASLPNVGKTPNCRAFASGIWRCDF